MIPRLAILFCVMLAAGAETLDRIAVTVGKHVIAESEIVTEIRVTAFIDSAPPEAAISTKAAPVDLSPAAKRAAAARLIDQYLILEDAAISRAPLPVRDADVAKLLEPLQARYASKEAYEAALQNAGVSEADLRLHFSTGLKLLRYSETRFQPEVDVTEEDLRTAYEKLMAEAKARQGSETTFSEQDFNKNKSQLQQLISAERLNQAMDRWLDMARADAQIQYREGVFQ